MPEKLFWGDTTTIGVSKPAITILMADVRSSPYTGIITKLRQYCLVSGNIKFGIYDTVSSVPTNLLWSDDSSTAVSAVGWNDIPIGNVSVTSGVEYAFSAINEIKGAMSIVADTQPRYYTSGLTYSTFTHADPFVSSGNDSNFRFAAGVLGWEVPTVTSISDSSFPTGQAGISLGGTDFMTTQGTGKLELCDNATYASATKFISQTVTSWGDSSIDFTSVQGTLTPGTVYAFVTTDLGQRNATGYPVTLESTGGTTVYAWIERADGSISGYPHEVILI